jgi:hypothetical protein
VRNVAGRKLLRLHPAVRGVVLVDGFQRLRWFGDQVLLIHDSIAAQAKRHNAGALMVDGSGEDGESSLYSENTKRVSIKGHRFAPSSGGEDTLERTQAACWRGGDPIQHGPGCRYRSWQSVAGPRGASSSTDVSLRVSKVAM